MVLTRAEGRKALTHVLENGFQLEKDHSLIFALSKKGLLDIRDVLKLSYDDIDNFTFPNDQGNDLALWLGCKILL
jgi:hypothetical protein